ncbi:hypothetical protein CEUSTIGMA_g2009.t1 [Chlamydomonas eustigma]|uniref:Uncharacterized protein n=1 Tax=Chlamydomonas eustigma TaxID=1157962 RepID=A0A250WVK2_9CHLO|nr:hypothetical protein CEUSTIGMA_g2009.t1 [Chlamydomonas eustigma]|eukprot:GAX74560.1 hypothetical protein CEUSTIGMA_g2009.t1 [Chlamydomonas eustigma]
MPSSLSLFYFFCQVTVFATKVFSRRDHGKIGDVSCVDDGLVNCRPQNGNLEQGSVKPPGEQLVDPGPDHLFSGYRTLTRQDAVRRRVNFPDVLKEEEEENRELNPAEVVEVELRDDSVTPLRLRSIQQSLLRKRTLSYSGLYPEGSLHMSQDSFRSSSASGVAPPVGPTIALLRGPSLTNRNMRGLTQRSKSVRELMSGLRSRRVAQGRSDVLSQMFAQESSGEGGSSVRFAAENVGSAVGIIAARELHKSSSCEVRALSRQSSSMVSDRQRRRSAAGNVLCRSALNNDLGLSAQINNGNRGLEVEGQDSKNGLEVFDSNKEGLHGLLVSLRSMRLRSLDDEFPPLYPEMMRENN